MEIKAETRTVYIVDGEEYATHGAAEVAACTKRLACILSDAGGPAYDFSVPDAAAACTKRLACILSDAGGPAYDFSVPDAAAALVSQREEIIKTLGGSLA